MKFTIITINFNNAPGLRKTLESVISQNFTNFEYIVIDGGSTDGSVDIIKKYAEKLTYWVSEQDKGVYHAMNKGVRRAKGEYVLFLNSGDILANDRVLEEVVLNRLDTDIVAGNAIYEASAFHEMKKVFSPKNIKASDIILSFLPHQATFIKRSLFEDLHLYNEELKIVADWAFFIEAILVRNKTYKSVNLFVAICETEGMSSNPANNELMENEFHLVLKDLLPQYYDDYIKLRKVNRNESTLRYQVLGKFENTLFFKTFWRIRKYMLKYGYYDLKARLKRKKYFRSLIQSDNRKKEEIRQKIYALNDNLLHRQNNAADIIVSVTSFGRRVEDSLPYALYSIFSQTKLPNRIVLYLDNQNWNDEKLPGIIKHLKKLGLEVYYCDDYRSYKKLIPALKQFPDNAIITIDDDIYYADGLIEALINEYRQSDKKTVICHWACIQEKRNGKFIPYSQWQDSEYGNEHSIYSPFGGDGTLYPPHIFDEEILNDEVFMKLAPTADDMWFWLMEYRQSINVRLLKNSKSLKNYYFNIAQMADIENSDSLYSHNCLNGQNDVQFVKLIEYYGYL